jgi:hypothetical protein
MSRQLLNSLYSLYLSDFGRDSVLELLAENKPVKKYSPEMKAKYHLDTCELCQHASI